MQAKMISNNIKSATSASSFRLVEPLDEEYRTLQKVVARKYFDVYQAKILPTPDVFGCLKRGSEGINFSGACYGVTSARKKILFSECYLDTCVEHVIFEKFGLNINRKKIAEFGSLASYQAPGSGTKLVQMIPWLSWLLGFDFVLATTTERIRGIMNEAKMTYHPLAKASVDRLNIEAQKNWGSYYETKPLVGIIDIKTSLYRSLFERANDHFQLNYIDSYHPGGLDGIVCMDRMLGVKQCNIN